MIPFNKSPVTDNEISYIDQAIKSGFLAGDGHFSKKCEAWFESATGTQNALLTPSCTHALEMAALLIDVQPGDEVIMPSYTFVSTANAFVLRGARIVFVDVHPKTMNINENLIEDAITEKTKAIVPVHYAGVACEMDFIMNLAQKYSLFVIEDAAQGVMSTYKGKALGSIGHLGAFSFHETKNYTSGGEGGLLLINDAGFIKRAEVLREKGTNRSQFFRGMVDKYSWVDVGSSFLPSEIQSAYLWAQLGSADKINEKRLSDWMFYFNKLLPFQHEDLIELPHIPEGVKHNAHMFYIKVENLEIRTQVLKKLKERGILAVFHYIPLHSSIAGLKFGHFHGEDKYTTAESERLLRLPMFYNLLESEREFVCNELIKILKEIKS